MTPRADVPQGFTVWLTGMSGAGKTTAALLLEQRLLASGAKVEVLDGDIVRARGPRRLGFSKEDRDENVRRIGVECERLSTSGIVAIAAAISPYRAVRDEVRARLTARPQGARLNARPQGARIANFVEVYMECPLELLIERDAKGLYKRALAGEIPCFTGVSDPYEPPLAPEVTIHSGWETPQAGVDKIVNALERLGLL